TGVGALPAGWSQWANSGAFAVSTDQALSRYRSLANDGVTGQKAVAWANTSQPANVQVSASVYLNSMVPAEILARGSRLNTNTPTFYAVTVTRGLQLKLVKVVNGVSTTLRTLTSANYLSGVWVKATLYVNGTTLRAQLYRPDTRQYLNSAGRWQSTPTWALTATDYSIRTSGLVGLGRASSYAGIIYFDDLNVLPSGGTSRTPLLHQSFDSTRVGSLPSGWSQWSNVGAFAVSTDEAQSSTRGLETTGTASLAARAWLNTYEPTNIQAGAAGFLNSLIPGQVFIRGKGLNTTVPTYYAASVTRGMQVQLVRVVNGVTTTLATKKSTTYLSGQWVYVSLQGDGSTLRVQVYRIDTGLY